MSIEKYLDGMKVPNGHPGPFSVKLKYDIKRRLLLRKKRQERVSLFMQYCNVLLFITVAVIIYKPDYAFKLNRTFSAKIALEDIDSQDNVADSEQYQAAIPLSDQGVELGSGFTQRSQQNSRIVPVSTASSSSTSSSTFQIMELSQLEEDTPYVIRKVKGQNQRFIYFVNEIAPESRARIPY